jgi:peroxiredoxin
MRLFRWGSALAAVLCLAAPAAAQEARDPNAVYWSILAWRREQLDKARADRVNPDLAALDKETIQRARSALKEFDPAKLDPDKAYWLAMLCSEAQDWTAMVAAARRAAGSDDPRRRSHGYGLQLFAYQRLGDLDGQLRTLEEWKPADAVDAARLAYTVGQRYGDLAAARKGTQAGLDLIAKYEAAAALDMLLKSPSTTGPDGSARPSDDRVHAENAIVEIAQGRARLYLKDGKKEEAVAALEAGRLRLPGDSRNAPLMEAKVVQLRSTGGPAPRLTRERGAGEFKSLADLNGKVVVLAFVVHGSSFCDRAYPMLKKLGEELGPKGVEVVLVTRLFGRFGDEANVSPEDESEKLKEHLAKHGLACPLVVGPEENFKRYGVINFPHFAVVDRKGRVRSHHVTLGYNDEVVKGLRESVEKAVAE